MLRLTRVTQFICQVCQVCTGAAAATPPPADVTDSGSKLSTTKYTKLYYRYVFLQNGCGAAQSVNLDLANKPKVSAKQ